MTTNYLVIRTRFSRSKMALLIAVLHEAKLAGSIPAASLKFRRDTGEKRNGINLEGSRQIRKW